MSACRLHHLSIIFALVLVLSCVSATAQELTGRLTGTVYDEQGGVVPGADVTATHRGTNAVYRAVTGGFGRFSLPGVRLGAYRVTVELAGFNRAVVENVLVETGAATDLNVRLVVGAPDQEVVVQGSAAQEIVNTVDAEIGAAVDERQVAQLPLNGRNASHLALLQAGVFFERSPDGQGDKLFVHGQRHRSIAITLDGIDTQDNLNRASSIMLDQPLMELSAENVQEFRVVTGISSAEYTRGGAHISAVTKSGSNDWHGSVFWFHRNDVFNANEFFNNSAGVEVPKLIRNQFGGSVGGPIKKDKTFFYFGYEQLRESRGIAVNRTVYTAEARQGIFRYLDDLRTTPENVAANPDLIRSVNLLACGSEVETTLGRYCVDSRFNASNPTSVDPFITGQVLGLVPLPNNFDLGDGLNTGAFRFNSASLTFLHKPAFRLDHVFNDNHNLYFSFNYNDRNIEGDFINGREPPYPDQPFLGARTTLTRAYSAALASSFGPTLINELRSGIIVGENGFIRNQPFPTPFTLDLNDITDPYEPGGGDSVRLNRTFNVRDTLTWVRGDHQFKFGFEFRNRYVNNRSLFETAPFGEIDFNRGDNPPGFSESNLRALSGGTDIISTDYNNARDLINNLVGAIGEVEIRYNVTSLTSGFVAGAFERRIYRDREVDAFFQDTWNLSPNLTLNLGLRWEFQSVPVELQGLTLLPEGGFDSVFGISGPQGFFNPGVLSGRACPLLGGGPVEPSTDNAVDLITGCTVPYVPGGANNGLPFWDDDYNNFGPVLGLAWDPWGNGKTSFRAGFRISYQQDVFSVIDGNIDDNEGLVVDQDCIPVDGNCQNNPTLLRDVLSGGPPVAPVPDFELPARRSILDSTAQDFRTFQEGLATPYYQEWTFGIQREILPNWALEVRYVGNHGVKQRRVADFNEINIFAVDEITGMSFLDAFVIAQLNLACNRAEGFGSRFDAGTGASCAIANPLMDALISGDVSRLRRRSALIDALDFNEPGEFVYRLTQRETSRPSSGESRIRGGSFWGQVLEGRFPANFFQANPFVHSSRAMVNDGSSQYHAFELELRRRFATGLSLQANYTFGKALADFDGDQNTLINDTRPSSVRFPRYTRQEFMPRHLFKVNWIYEIPLGPGHRYLAGNNVWSKVLGGWQFGGIINARSGRPLTITSGVGTFHRSAISDDNTVDLATAVTRGELQNMTGRRDIGGGVFWFDPCLSSELNAQCSDPSAIAGLFQLPQAGRLGQLGQTEIFGPSSFALDFNLRKVTRLTEGTQLEFRWEVFNAFNNVSFANPATNVFSASFGQILRTVGNPRLMQFALRLSF